MRSVMGSGFKCALCVRAEVFAERADSALCRGKRREHSLCSRAAVSIRCALCIRSAIRRRGLCVVDALCLWALRWISMQIRGHRVQQSQ